MKYFSGDLILYPSFSKLFFCDERMLRPSFLCEGVDHLGQQKFQRMSRGAILFRTGGREECSDHGGDEPGKGSISHHSREVGVQSSTQKIFTQCLAKGYVSSQEGSHFEGFALKHSQCYHCLGWECNDPPGMVGRTREDFESTVLFTSFAKMSLFASRNDDQPTC